MRKILVNLLLITQLSVFSQIHESFENASFFEEINCYGTKEKFIVNEQEELQLNDVNASGTSNSAYLSLPSEAINDAVWNLKIKISTTTSSSNYVRYYLVSDNADLSLDLNGYYVMAGNTSDEISLYKQQGSVKTKIIDGADARVATSTVDVSIKITRSKDGDWMLLSKLPAENEYVVEGTCSDNSISNSAYSGLFVQYSSGNKFNYIFDDWSVVGQKQEPPYQVQTDDVIFNELMVKPSPSVGLPAAEYIELYNRTDEKINLSGFFVVDKGKKYKIENATVLPKSYLLLCSKSSLNDFSSFGNCVAMDVFPTLTDEGKLLWIENAEGEIISWIEYTSVWYKDAFKSSGGWALERIDVNNVSADGVNWRASLNTKGGTPSEENSVKGVCLDIQHPTITNLFLLSNNSIQLFFNEEIAYNNLLDIQNYITENCFVDSIKPIAPQYQSVLVFFKDNFVLGTTYSLHMKNIADKAGNVIEEKSIKFALPEEISFSDVVINEILFNPTADGFDYVELYNRSNKVLDLSDLMITNRNENELQAGVLISSEVSLLFPNEYLLFSANVEKVCFDYNCSSDAKKIKLSSIPSFPDDKGNVVLVTRSGQIIDELFYTEKMHHALVKNAEGVSLERINPHESTQHSQNWHSASFESGYGTPGYENSQFKNETVFSDEAVWLTPQVFSPNNDGTDDLLEIHYDLEGENHLASISIFDAGGSCVKKLINNVLLDTQGVFRWNGETDQRKTANVGIYIVYVEVFNTKGKINQWKLACVLSD